jgi:hypothetical protein
MPIRHEKTMSCRRPVVVLLALAIFVPGCGSGDVKLAKVKGTVTLDGAPLPKGTVTFESQGQRPATGTIVNGEIVEVTTYAPGDGIPLGHHKIAISATEDSGSAVAANPGEGKVGANYMSGKSLIPAMYNDPSTSGLTADIKAGENTVEFKLTAQPAKGQK